MENRFTNSVSKMIKLIVIIFLLIFTLFAGALGVSIVGVLEETPETDIGTIDEKLQQTSEILDSEGNKLETIQTAQFRELVPFSKIPKNLSNAFIALEDERFYKHDGVDPIGILSAVKDNLVHSTFRGASTLAQQLARNIYALPKNKVERKIEEAYLAIQLTEELGREGILEKYMNTVPLGQNSYGVQAASKTYFGKNVEELTLAECASLASIVKSPTNYALYRTSLPENITEDSIVLGDLELNGVDYKVVYNDTFKDRQKHALKKMLENEYITKEEYDAAINEDISKAIKPGETSTKQVISSYFTDLVANQVIEHLQKELNYTKTEATTKYYTGGLKIYSTIDVEMQNKVQTIFEDFSKVALRGAGSNSRPALLRLSTDNAGNITNSKRVIVYYKKSNLVNEEGILYLNNSEYTVNEDGSLSLPASKFNIYGSFIDPKDYYTVNDQKNLVTHAITTSGKKVAKKGEIVKDNDNIIVSKKFLDKNTDFYNISENGILTFGDDYFAIDKEGIPQPQGSISIIDHNTGQIKAIVGGRNQEGRKILNRATDVPRQPGSTIKPISVYTPALDNGYTAASPIDDTPYKYNGKLWPKNVYQGFRGLVSLRESVADSINVNAVKTVLDVGIEKSKSYLDKFGIINKENINEDNYISASENSQINDENPAAMALGSMTHGVTNLEITGAYAALANGGEYIEPLTFTKVVDFNGDVLLEDVNKKTEVVSEQTAYVMTDIMKDVLKGYPGSNAYNPTYEVAGKTGTTQENQDIWFVGYTPYYTIGSWVGFDNQQLKLSENGGQAVFLWNAVNRAILDGLEPAKFKEPEGIVHMTACTIGNAKPTSACYSDHRGLVKNEIFVKGTEPTTYCKVHVFGSNGLMLNRPIPYDPINGLYPRDWNIFTNRKKDDDKKKDDDDKKDDENNNSGDNNSNNNVKPPVTTPKPETPAPPVVDGGGEEN